MTDPGRIPVGECPARPPRWRHPSVLERQGGKSAATALGVDIACRAAHQASLADAKVVSFGAADGSGRAPTSSRRSGAVVARRHRGHRRDRADPQRLGPARLVVSAQGATVVMVPSEQSADLRDYYSKHTKSDRLDSKLLARIPLLHPEGLYAHEHLGPAEPIRRATRLRSSLVKRRLKSCAGSTPSSRSLVLSGTGPSTATSPSGASCASPPPATPTPTCADESVRPASLDSSTAIPTAISATGGRPSAGAANETLSIWGDELDYGELADDIAVEARLALASPQRSTSSSSASP